MGAPLSVHPKRAARMHAETEAGSVFPIQSDVHLLQLPLHARHQLVVVIAPAAIWEDQSDIVAVIDRAPVFPIADFDGRADGLSPGRPEAISLGGTWQAGAIC